MLGLEGGPASSSFQKDFWRVVTSHLSDWVWWRFLRRRFRPPVRRFARVRAPWVKKKLRVRASLRTVQRTIHDAGYWLPKLIQERVLDKATLCL